MIIAVLGNAVFACGSGLVSVRGRSREVECKHATQINQSVFCTSSLHRYMMPVVFSFWAVSAMPIKLRIAHSCRCVWSAILHFMSSMGGHLDDTYSKGCVAFAFC